MCQTENDAYYSRRYVEEMDAGNVALNRSVAAVHFEMASRYAVLAATTQPATFQLRVVEEAGAALAA